MSKLKKNPFEIFGLTPQIVKELDDETVFKLIKGIYKVLQMKYHPDRGGDPRRALELNLAFESLNYEKNPQGFLHYKKNYIKRLSRKTLRNELDRLESIYRKHLYQLEMIKEKFWNYLTGDFPLTKKPYNNNLSFKLKIFDIISYINYSNIVTFKRRNYFFKEIYISQGLVIKRSGIDSKPILLKNYHYLGSVKRENLEPWSIMQRDFMEERFILKNYLSRDTFIKEVLILLNPEVKANCYVFFYDPAEPQKVFLEGVAIKVEEITPLEFIQTLQLSREESSEKGNAQHQTDLREI